MPVTHAQHADDVFERATKSIPSSDDFVGHSWTRSLAHKLDPASSIAPTILTTAELIDARGPLERLAALASDELDQLFATIRHAGYAVLLCSDRGIVIEHRGERDETDRYRFWGSWLGAVWSEDLEGTNGVGTCIIERRPITIHRTQHFRSRHIGLSCSSAPIFDDDETLIAVLDASSMFPNLSETAHAFVGGIAVATARSIEERLFRERFRSSWIVALRSLDAQTPGMLLSVDREGHIVGRCRWARRFLETCDRTRAVRASLWSLFERQPGLLRAPCGVDMPASLTLLKDGGVFSSLITPPEDHGSRAWRNYAVAAQHTRPRLDLISRFAGTEPPPARRGGMAPLALRRVREHVEDNIDQTIDLQTLASVAGLSVHHFARAFKAAEGVTPHKFIVRHRIERAKLLLIQSKLSLTEIAMSCGFADQSHFARCFRQSTGDTPGSFRSTQR